LINLKIITHSGNVYEVTVAEYDPVQTNENLNNSIINTVTFAEIILSRIDVKAVIPF
jgi:hypothetical protein